MSRSVLRSVAGVLIGVLLFAQLAIAAYACPGGAWSANTQRQSMDMPSMQMAQGAPCDMGKSGAAMDPQNANLCAEHCRLGQQSDHACTLDVPAAMWMALYFTAPLWRVPLATARAAAASPSVLVAASAPRTVLHCCLRI